jgi:hypothetical protein
MEKTTQKKVIFSLAVYLGLASYLPVSKRTQLFFLQFSVKKESEKKHSP